MLTMQMEGIPRAEFNWTKYRKFALPFEDPDIIMINVNQKGYVSRPYYGVAPLNSQTYNDFLVGQIMRNEFPDHFTKPFHFEATDIDGEPIKVKQGQDLLDLFKGIEGMPFQLRVIPEMQKPDSFKTVEENRSPSSAVPHPESTPSSSGSVLKTPAATDPTQQARLPAVPEVPSELEPQSHSFKQAEENRRPILSHHDFPAASSTSVPRTTPATSLTQQAVHPAEFNWTKHRQFSLSFEDPDIIMLRLNREGRVRHPFYPFTDLNIKTYDEYLINVIMRNEFPDYYEEPYHFKATNSDGLVIKVQQGQDLLDLFKGSEEVPMYLKIVPEMLKPDSFKPTNVKENRSPSSAVPGSLPAVPEVPSELEPQSHSFKQAEENRRPILSHHDFPAASSTSVPRTTPATSLTQQAVHPAEFNWTKHRQFALSFEDPDIIMLRLNREGRVRHPFYPFTDLNIKTYDEYLINVIMRNEFPDYYEEPYHFKATNSDGLVIKVQQGQDLLDLFKGSEEVPMYLKIVPEMLKPDSFKPTNVKENRSPSSAVPGSLPGFNMANDTSVSFKASLDLGGKTEVRRFVLDHQTVTSFGSLESKLRIIFPTLRNNTFSITWKDNDNDFVVISSDDELILFLSEMRDGPRRLYITITFRLSSRVDVHEGAANIAAGAASAGLLYPNRTTIKETGVFNNCYESTSPRHTQSSSVPVARTQVPTASTAPTQQKVHSDFRKEQARNVMKVMGYKNKGRCLTNLLEQSDYDVDKAIDILIQNGTI